MKNTIFVFIIFSLIIFTTLIKNSSKEIDKEIFKLEEDISILKNVPIPQGSSLEFMSGNKVVLETADTLTVNSDTNNSIDASLTIMEIT